MVYCYVCDTEIHIDDWPDHVDMEKKRHGKDIYKKLKAEREERLKCCRELEKHPHNKKLDDF